MLNITKESISKFINKEEFSSYKKLEGRSSKSVFIRVLIVFLLIFSISLFLPWTQNIRSKGYVTTLNPFDKPQEIQSQIEGKIKQWYVLEGDIVTEGDTIAVITESKEAYLDPLLINNTKEQQKAKLNSADSYSSKTSFLQNQLSSLKENFESKLAQIKIKQKQIDLKIETTVLDLEAADTYLANAEKQLTRMQEMYKKGIKSLTELEEKELSKRNAVAKRNSINNKLKELANDKTNLIQENEVTKTDYAQKAAKIESEIQSAQSYRFSLLGESNKLQSKVNQLEQRRQAYVIKSPVTGKVMKVLKNGIGEFVKAQESIATIVPTDYEKAVELYVVPNDMPLIKVGKKVRLQFDGWPAVVFSGWPENSMGTFGGEVYAIDNNISENGKYRILIIEDGSDKKWPELIRLGSGAQGLLLLNDVKIYYELWRKLNGFPPDFYNPEEVKKVKNKAPIKKVK